MWTKCIILIKFFIHRYNVAGVPRGLGVFVSQYPMNEYQINPVKWLVNDCKYMKIIYVNCSWTKAIWKWPSQLYEHYLSNSENKAWKNSGLYGTSGINFHYCITARITSIFVSSTIVYMIIFIYLQSFIHHFMGLFVTKITTSSQLAC